LKPYLKKLVLHKKRCKMRFFNYFFLIMLLNLFVLNNLKSQEIPSQPNEPKSPDSTNNERVNILPDDDFEFSFKNKDFKFKISSSSTWTWKPEKPFINFEYGQANYSNKDYQNFDFKSNSPITLVLGYYKDAYKGNSTLFSSKTRDFFISYFSNQLLEIKKEVNGFDTENWQFGINWGKGYGNEFHKNFKIYFNHKSGYSWTRFYLKDNGNFVDTIFVGKFERYDEKFKFGEQFQSSGSIVLFELVNINASYQRIHVYPAHMFWYWSLSQIIESAAHSILDEFVDEIIKFSPDFTPIFNIILKTGLSYGIYELRRNNMNWPIETEPPFVIENFKIGLGFNF